MVQNAYTCVTFKTIQHMQYTRYAFKTTQRIINAIHINHFVGQTGEVGFYEDLVCSQGKRCEHSATIQFDPPFGVPPAVMEAFSTLDSARDKNLRVVSEVSDITTETAKLRVFTWDDSNLYGAKLSWIACPKLG